MGKGRTKFQTDWFEKELDGVLLKEWLESVTGNDYSAKCSLCCETFEVSGSGFAQVRSHHKGKKHHRKFDERFKGNGQSTIFNWVQNKSSDTAVLSQQSQILKAETLWCLHVAKKNISFKSCTDTVDLFKVMFPDSPIASAMQLKEKKTAYVLNHGVSKYFEDLLMKDIDSATKITLAFDESTNVQNKRQLDVYARYWSADFNLVVCRYLKSVFLGHATAGIILHEVLDVLSTYKIPLNKVICLSMDNPNVNKSVMRKFSDQIGSNTLLPIGTCNLHVANNGFKVFLNSLDVNFDEFANDIYFFLKNSAVRREDFNHMEEITEGTAQFLLRHVNSRWLTAGPVAQRLVEQWANISEYFLCFLPKQKLLTKQLSSSSKYKRICDNLKEPSILCFLAFIAYTHKHFETFSLCFQSESPKIHLLFSEMNKLIRQVMMLFIKDDIVAAKEGTDLRDIELENGKNWKKSSSIEIGIRLIKEGTERLKKAAGMQNIVEMTVAQNLISEGTDQLTKLESELTVFETGRDQLLSKRLKIK
nr:uncharacterized protein LOC122270948 [Parasteatoda tepidariorum]